MSEDDLRQIEELIKKHKPKIPDHGDGLGCLAFMIVWLIIMVSCKH